MREHRLLISPAAQNDLGEIYRFGLRQWGQAQASRYLDDFKAQFWALTTQPFAGIERRELWPDMRSIPLAKHVIFYRVCATRVEIVRVLHARQDPAKQAISQP